MTLPFLLLAVAALAVACVSLRAARAAQSKVNELEAVQRRLQREHSKLGDGLARLRNAAVSLTRTQRDFATRLARTDAAFRRLQGEWQTRVAAPQELLSQRTLEGAIRQLRQGAAAEELVRHFGLSPAEAELLAKLHGRAH
ncbi:MAG TPA: DUF2802 domain-containing protein [Gammaproteobacteria bacterium]|nr:DUF2802 domain-containing protein [Gammaproteobacteria bacterium]